ncbi:MAG: formate dehydrogenase subunit gamma [Betaproteobacteria bacterium]
MRKLPSLHRLLTRLLNGPALAGALAVCLAASAAAQTAAPAAAPAVAAAPEAKGPPAGFVAPAEPKPDETNAQRAKTQPGNNAPFWRDVRESGNKEGTVSMPIPEGGTLVQRFVQYPGSSFTTAGEAWRQVRNRWIIPYGGSLLLISALALGLFYWRKGAMGGHEPDTGRVIERFTPLERAAHWTNAIAFVVLAVSGIVMAFGKFFLLPVLGSTLFGWLTYALKNAHNFAGPLFAVSLVIVFITFIKDNLPRKEDLTWLVRAGGMFGGAEVPSHRFNAGEKGVFWAGVFGLGLVVVGSGLVLDMVIPGLAYLRGDMQIAHMIHATASVLMMALFLGHIYMGTIGMKGAYSAMRTGYVDEGWAKEHHALWYEDIQAGKIPAQRSAPQGAAAATPPQAA